MFDIKPLATSLALASYGTLALAQTGALEEVIVTGSYIKRESNATSASPISQYGSDVIEGLAAIAVGDVLNTFPQVTVQSNGDGFNTIPFWAGTANIGVSSVSLRNLGSARTLVLLNGRRYVSGVSANTGFGVDLNSIPTSMIERIDQRCELPPPVLVVVEHVVTGASRRE